MKETESPLARPAFAWRARISADAPLRASVYARRHSFVVGRPVEFDEEADALSALEYLLGALGADVLNGFCAEAKRRRLRLDRAEATVEGTLDNPLTHLNVVGEVGHPGLTRAVVKVYASTLAPEDSVKDAWMASLERSPLVRTLRPAVDLTLNLEVLV